MQSLRLMSLRLGAGRSPMSAIVQYNPAACVSARSLATSTADGTTTPTAAPSSSAPGGYTPGTNTFAAAPPKRNIISTQFLADLLSDDKRPTLKNSVASDKSAASSSVGLSQPSSKPRLNTIVSTTSAKRCFICSNNIIVDYKNVRLLSQFVSENTGSIIPRRVTGTCAKQQRAISNAIMRARQAGLMPYLYKTPRFTSNLEGIVWES